MKRYQKSITGIAVCALLVITLTGYVHAESVDDIQILKISAKDGRAVIRIAGGETQMVREGEKLTVTGDELRVAGERQKTSCVLRVMEISEGRIVFEERKGDEIEKVIISIDNVTSGELRGAGLTKKEQTVTRIRKTPDERPVFYKAVSNQQLKK